MMAHYAWIDDTNRVINVTVGVDENITQQGVGGSTEAWETFYTKAVNQKGVYIKRTSYNSKIRGNYSGIGMFYCDEHDLFMPVKCHNEAVLNVETAKWDCTNSDHDSHSII